MYIFILKYIYCGRLFHNNVIQYNEIGVLPMHPPGSVGGKFCTKSMETFLKHLK